MADAPITFFIPLGSDRSNAGLTVRAESIDELNATLKDLTDSDSDEVSKLDDVLDSVLAIRGGLELKGLNAVQQAPARSTSNHPQASTSAPDAPSCAHGQMKWKEGISKKTGEPYKGWFCPAPFGQTQCPPKFIK